MAEEHHPQRRLHSRIRRRRVTVSFDEDALIALDHIITRLRATSGIAWRQSDLIREAVNQFIGREQERQHTPRHDFP